MDREEPNWFIQLEGECTINSALELKPLLVEGLASGKELRIDLIQVCDVDITMMQVLWAAEREASRHGVGIEILASEAAITAARNAGFERFPGTGDSGSVHG